MKNIKSSVFFRIIYTMLIVIILANAFAPICSYAAADDDEDSDFGGKLFKPIAKLVVRNI